MRNRANIPKSTLRILQKVCSGVEKSCDGKKICGDFVKKSTAVGGNRTCFRGEILCWQEKLHQLGGKKCVSPSKNECPTRRKVYQSSSNVVAGGTIY
ncbi:MAG: hypothetical protein J6Q33_03955, partial [Alistipes sp.]|nr:hypothetical protein [Alistipes sp.]